jgi:aerobic-type carbon monoxide dehydrogenase small subunit (CoxS/CutS family)
MPQYTLSVNDREQVVDAPAEMPILWVLRDLLGMTGTKYGCGVGSCGSCTVRLDGRAVRGCLTPVSAAAGRSLQTIEGLSELGDHPLQAAWVAEDVPQCGYCQAGFIMAAAALLAEKPEPDDADIDSALGDLVCRCGTYQRVRAAIHSAAKGA